MNWRGPRRRVTGIFRGDGFVLHGRFSENVNAKACIVPSDPREVCGVPLRDQAGAQRPGSNSTYVISYNGVEIGICAVTEEKVVKSVGRVLDLLEYLDDVRRPVSVMEVSRALGAPQSSASALLRSLVARGYCKVDPVARRYLPTARVSILGSWIDAPIFEDGAILRLLHDINSSTGELVLLASLTGLQVRLIYALAAQARDRPRTRAGTLRPLARSGLGNLFLATFSDRQIGGLVRRINAEESNRGYHVRPAALMADIAVIRSQGYAVALDNVAPGVGGVNVLLPRLKSAEPMAVAISTHSSIVAERHAAFFALIRDAVQRHLKQDLPPVLGPSR